MAQLTKGLTFEWAPGADSLPTSGWTKIPDIQSIPTLIGTPSNHDVTTIYDDQKTYIEGLADNGGTLAFKGFMTPELISENDKIIKSQASRDVWFRVGLPSPLNKAYAWTGTSAILSNDEASPDNPLQCTMNVTATSSVSFADYTSE